MSVTYEPPLTRSGARIGESLLREVIESGPAYVRTRGMGRWHRVRSGQRVLREWSGELVETYQTWCGQIAGSNHRSGPALLTDEPPSDDPLCGTCEGRFIGARTEDRWLFQPRRLDPPKRCPGSHTMLVREDQGRYNRATCLVCGDVVKMGAHGGPYATRWDARVHEPGPGLIAGCPWHAWRELTLARDENGEQVAACRCQTVERAS